MDDGMLPFRKLSERSNSTNCDISWPILIGIGPESKLPLKENAITLGDSGSEPSK